LSVKFEELVYIARTVNCHVYTCLTVLTSDMLRYDKLTAFNPYTANVENIVIS